MSSTNKTPVLDLPQWTGENKPTFLGDFNIAMSKIDTAVGQLQTSVSDAGTTASGALESAQQAASAASSANQSAATAATNATTAVSVANNALTVANNTAELATEINNKIANLTEVSYTTPNLVEGDTITTKVIGQYSSTGTGTWEYQPKITTPGIYNVTIELNNTTTVGVVGGECTVIVGDTTLYVGGEVLINSTGTRIHRMTVETRQGQSLQIRLQKTAGNERSVSANVVQLIKEN